MKKKNFFLALSFCTIFATCKTQQNDDSESQSVSTTNWSAFAPITSYTGIGPNNDRSGMFQSHTVLPNSSSPIKRVFSPHPNDYTSIAVINDGLDSLRARVESIRYAEESIRIQSLIFTGDESGQLIAEELIKKFDQFKAKFTKEFRNSGMSDIEATKKGYDKAQTKVRIIIDQLSNLDPNSNAVMNTRKLLFRLKSAGIEVMGFENFLGGIATEICATDLLCANKRFHEKLWIIDAERPTGFAIIGGINIANEYFRTNIVDHTDFWADQDVAIKGSAIKDITAAFERNFAREGMDKSLFADFVDAFLKIKWGAVRFFDWLATQTGINTKFVNNPRIETYIKQALFQDIQLNFTPAKVRFFQQRPRIKETYITQLYLKSIREAKSEILINNAYFVPIDEILNELIAAARRGVHIKLMTNHPLANDLPMITYVGRQSYKQLLEVNKENKGKITLYEWVGWNGGLNEPREGTNHSKYAIFDRSLSIVGSYNLDPRSHNLNSESVVAFESKIQTAHLAKIFDDSLRKANNINSFDKKVLDEYHNPTDPEIKKKLELGLKIRNWL